MNGLRAGIAFVLVVALGSPCASAGAQDNASTPRAGSPAPSLEGVGVVLVREADDATTRPATVIFSKPGDAHTSDAIRAIAELHRLHPRLGEGSRTILVVSRLGGASAAIPDGMPAKWQVLRDSEDTLYAAYRIIATPSVAVIDRDERIVGYHAGFNAGLAEALRRDLVLAIDGPEALNAPTPTPGIMDVQMGRQLARRRLWDRALVYYRKAAEAGPLPCDIALEEVEIHLELQQPAEAIRLLDGIGEQPACAAQASGLRTRAQALAAAREAGESEPPDVR